jgi:hypothetical protein
MFAVETYAEEHDERGEPYQVVTLTEQAWDWIESNESLFAIRRPSTSKRNIDIIDDDIPF